MGEIEICTIEGDQGAEAEAEVGVEAASEVDPITEIQLVVPIQDIPEAGAVCIEIESKGKQREIK